MPKITRQTFFSKGDGQSSKFLYELKLKNNDKFDTGGGINSDLKVRTKIEICDFHWIFGPKIMVVSKYSDKNSVKSKISTKLGMVNKWFWMFEGT